MNRHNQLFRHFFARVRKESLYYKVGPWNKFSLDYRLWTADPVSLYEELECKLQYHLEQDYYE